VRGTEQDGHIAAVANFAQVPQRVLVQSRLLAFEPLYEPKGMNRLRYEFEFKSPLLTL
jgi:hypothetical protein